ncbi:hypothetical protein Ahy_A01g003783 isoform B [Arachis hypogaea]|uniref:Uncharacterized protein n=1 Tax=Arachis hypogaea TaxID=3818 RepID=A0A445EUB3_ARAHY|nr:hypothetical protein Ahy_A01g003783 isoform B [Arachis hypogaea]
MHHHSHSSCDCRDSSFHRILGHPSKSTCDQHHQCSFRPSPERLRRPPPDTAHSHCEGSQWQCQGSCYFL